MGDRQIVQICANELFMYVCVCVCLYADEHDMTIIMSTILLLPHYDRLHINDI